MGQFSWLDCKTREQILDNKRRKVYALVPEEFGGGHIEEDYYDGYGRFGGKDIYDLVALWNRKRLSAMPNFVLPSKGTPLTICPWYKTYADPYLSDQDLVYKLEDLGMELREIGIHLACYDEDNAALPYPIKITYDSKAKYEDYSPSDADPNQGYISVRGVNFSIC